VRYGFAYGGVAAAVMAFTAITVQGSSVRADAPDDAIVARVGSQTITAGELSRRLQSIPPFQLRTFGKTEDEIKRNFLERVMIRDLLLSQGAIDRKLDKEEAVEDRVRATMRSAMVQTIRLDAQSAPITDADAKKYYDENPDKFHAPERIAIWRILVGSREDALKIVEEMKKDTSVKHWNDLARDRSVDKATNMRGGNLGYVDPDGKTTDAAITVDKAVLDAVKEIKDGEMSPAPVKEGDRWGIVWRRQTMKRIDRPFEQEAVGIKQTLLRMRAEEKTKALLDKAREEHVRDVNLEMADEVTVSAQGDLTASKRPGTLPSRKIPAVLIPPGHDHR
jgi:peptidyl-prolyl cis-trans isomerase C